jgi:AraC-like DNA-binding protein
VAAVADRCGFGDEERMRRAFLRQLKVSPSAYRERFRDSHGAVAPELKRFEADKIMALTRDELHDRSIP